MTLDEARTGIGRGVVYRSFHGAAEDGVITGVSDSMVFVRYAGDQHSKATPPERLVWLSGGAA